MGIVTVSVDEANKLEALKQKANAEYASGDFQRATNSYNKILEINPNDYYAIYRIGICDAYECPFSEIELCQVLNYCFRALNVVQEIEISVDEKNSFLKDMSIDLYDFSEILLNNVKSYYTLEAKERTSVIAKMMFDMMNTAKDICDFICDNICQELYWNNEDIINCYIKTKKLSVSINEQLLVDIKYADSYVESALGPMYQYQTYFLVDTAKIETREHIKTEKDLLKYAERIKIRNSLAKEYIDGNNNIYTDITLLETEIEQLKSQIVKYEEDIFKEKQIVSNNKMALFGANAKLKRQAQNKISNLEAKISSIKKELVVKENKLKLLSEVEQSLNI